MWHPYTCIGRDYSAYYLSKSQLEYFAKVLYWLQNWKPYALKRDEVFFATSVAFYEITKMC